jgi:NAD+ synthase
MKRIAKHGGGNAPDLTIDPKWALPLLEQFLRTAVRRAHLNGVVIGLSGGVDSALAAALAARALGPDKVHPVYLPSAVSSPKSRQDAAAAAKKFNLKLAEVSIAPQVDDYLARLPANANLRRGNFQARSRMAVLFDRAMALGCGVLGTSNKTELLLGYGTWHGDMASSFNPLGDLYKTQIWQLSRALKLPQSVIRKPATADLWAGQTDEAEMGITYELADQILALYIDAGLAPAEVIARGYPEKLVKLVQAKIRRSHFKRNLPLIPKLSRRTIGIDYLYPADWQGE